MLYPQNGDRIVAIDSVTSLHPVYFENWNGTVLRDLIQVLKLYLTYNQNQHAQ